MTYRELTRNFGISKIQIYAGHKGKEVFCFSLDINVLPVIGAASTNISSILITTGFVYIFDQGISADNLPKITYKNNIQKWNEVFVAWVKTVCALPTIQ